VAELDTLLAIVDEALRRIRAARQYELRLFDVRDLLEAQSIRTVPHLGLESQRLPSHAKKGAGGGACLSFGDDDSGYEGAVVIEPDKLDAIVKSSTGADSAWAEPASYDLHNGTVIVSQTPGELARIEHVLEQLRKDRRGNVEVQVDWYRAETAFLTALGAGRATLSREGLATLESEAIAGERVSRVASGFLVARRGETSVLHGGNETAYISGFEQSSGGTGMMVEKVSVPFASLVRQGLALEALGRGDVSGAEGTLTLGARVGLLRLTELPSTQTPAGVLKTPVLEEASTEFEGIAPAGALVLVVGRHPGEKRPAVVAVLQVRAR
jgi:hypothetical protein